MKPSRMKQIRVAIIGAGPAGLTAAYFLAREGVSVTVLEADPHYVGGISRTVKRDGFHFDIGGHRFFSKSEQVEAFWQMILPDDMLERPRSSRIYYNKKFFHYPLKPLEALWKLGFLESTLCVLSYFKARLRPHRNPISFQDWVSNQFGGRLFRIFFKTYTEKVWGMSCGKISADWAAQRIKGLSLLSALLGAFKKPKSKDQVIKTLINTFRYPRKGPGMMWEACAAQVMRMGGKILKGKKASSFVWDQQAQSWKILAGDSMVIADHVISSAPMRELIPAIEPRLSFQTVQAAEALSYRDFITVVLVLKGPELFDDNWIYIHDPSVKVGRIQNFKSWSPEMVPSPEYGCYGLEYFCFEGDGLWNKGDDDLISLARKELRQMGMGSASEFDRGYVVRQPKAYPVYDEHYSRHVDTIRTEIEKRHPTLHLVGRNGMHRYNNQDHAMMTAMLTAKNILKGERLYDVWKVNQDAEYHEGENGRGGESGGSSSGAGGLRAVPRPIAPDDAVA